MIQVLIVEDSITQREILRRLVEDDPGFAVVAEARNGREAVALVQKHTPDVVLMDIHMPDMDGIQAAREIMEQWPVPIVIASASLKRHDIDLALSAFQAGAVAVIEKPEGAVLLNLAKMGPRLRNELAAAAQAKVNRRVLVRSVKQQSAANLSIASGAIAAIGICASTGGPPVLLEILGAIPRPYPLPILLVQHISQGFEEGFARWLSQATAQPAGMARNGQRLEAGIWLAPSGYHLTIGSSGRLDLPVAASTDIHTPSGNPLFESLAKQLGARAAGILLTGMGDDGATGLLTLKKAGGLTIIQNEASCLIWGMPKTAHSLGAATLDLTPKEIARVLAEIVDKQTLLVAK